MSLYDPHGLQPTVDMGRCREAVFEDMHSYQCSRKVAVTRDGIGYCRQHDPEAVEARRAAREKRWDEERKRERKASARRDLARRIGTAYLVAYERSLAAGMPAEGAARGAEGAATEAMRSKP